MNYAILSAIGPEGFRPYRIDLDTMTFEATDRSQEGLLVPGFVDLHIHGAFGVDFMACSADELVGMADALQKVGYEAFLPTTVTASVEAVRTAIEKRPPDDVRMPGFHLEGPFISPKHPGAQPPEAIVAPSPEWDVVVERSDLRVITLAPEVAGPLVGELAQRGVVVSLGHTDATYRQVGEAVRAGARHTTHTYNAMRPLHHREAGTVGAALTMPELTCELIYDRIHVSRPAAELLLKCKGDCGVIAVSDATMAAGMASGSEIRMWGLDCVVQEGSVRLKDGTLAGSAITLYDAFRFLAQDFGPETAIRLCALNPRRALGMAEPKVWLVTDPEYRILEIRS